MPSSSVHSFNNPDEYGPAIQAARAEMTAIGGGEFRSKLVRIRLHRLWMQHYDDTASHITRAAMSPTRTIIAFSKMSEVPLFWGGQEIPWGAGYQFGTGQEVFQHTTGPVEFGTMSLPRDDFAAAAENLTHRSTKAQSDGQIFRPAPEKMTVLLRLHAAAAALAESAPSVLANPEAARSLEQELTLAMVTCTAPEAAKEDSIALRHQQAIMRKFQTLIEENVGNPLYLSEICATLGVSVRTMQRCCHEHLGVRPLRYLWLRRMQMVHRTLAASAPDSRNITDVATQYGFWELGRFSVEYRDLFGERPSETLHRRPGDDLKLS